MILIQFRCFALLLALVSFVLGLAPSLPPLQVPKSVAEGEDAIQQLWYEASSGRFSNVLAEPYQHLQKAWEHFLVQDGEGIVEAYYRFVVSNR